MFPCSQFFINWHDEQTVCRVRNYVLTTITFQVVYLKLQGASYRLKDRKLELDLGLAARTDGNDETQKPQVQKEKK